MSFWSLQCTHHFSSHYEFHIPTLPSQICAGFFFDILIYSSNGTMYLEYVKQAFEILRQHQFYIKFSKCAFGKQELEYLVVLLLLRE
jgi:hypothetical protein